jgi:hypothetical protein
VTLRVTLTPGIKQIICNINKLVRAAAKHNRGDFLAEKPQTRSLARRSTAAGRGRAYLISDRPLTEDEWIEQRTKMIESKPLVDTAAGPSENRKDEAST